MTSDCPEQQYCHPESLLCVFNQPPEIRIAAPAQGEEIFADELEISGLAYDDDSALASLEVSFDRGVTWTRIATTQQGEFVERVPLPKLDFKPYPVKFRATDEQGFTSELELQLYVDTVSPTCAFIDLRDGDFVGQRQDGRLEIAVSAADGSGPPAIELQNDDQPLTLTPGDAPDRFIGSIPVESDEHRATTFTLRVEDRASRVCSQTITVTIDQQLPSISLRSPDGGIINSATAVLRVSGDADDNGHPIQVSVDFDDDAGHRSAEVSGTGWFVDIPLPQQDYRQHTLIATVRDLAGNENSTSLSVGVDRLAPRLKELSPGHTSFDGGAFTTSDEIVYRFRLEDAANPTLTASVKKPGALFWDPLAADATSFRLPTNPSDNGAQYRVLLSTRDSNGNASQLSWMVDVDRVRPTLVTEPQNGARGAPLHFTATFSELMTSPPGIAPAVTPSVQAGRIYSYNSLVPDTTYTFRVPTDVTDLYGNPLQGPDTVTFRTEAKSIDAGMLGIIGVVQLEAANDQDGAVTIATRQLHPFSGAQQFAIYSFDPQTGTRREVLKEPGTTSSGTFGAIARRQNDDAGSPQRLHGYVFNDPSSGGHVRWNFDAQAASVDWSTAPMAMRPTPTACKGDGPPRVALYDNGNFQGINVLEEPDFSFPATEVVVGSESSWVGVGFDGGTLLQQSVRCTCNGTKPTCTRHNPIAIGATSPDTWNAVAFPNGVIFHVTAGEAGRCVTAGSTFVVPDPLPGPEGRLGKLADGGIFAITRSGSALTFSTREIENCDTKEWIPFGSISGIASNTQFRAVRSGSLPAAVLLRANGEVELRYPTP